MRVALGAQRKNVLTFVVGRGIKLAVFGVICGLIGAIFFTTALQSFAFGINPLNLLNFAGGILFIMVAFGASFGYTVMARISLLIGRFQFLIDDWIMRAILGN